MLDFTSALNIHQNGKQHSITNNNLKDKCISGSLISDTSPVYLFCTNKNGINSKNENGWTPIYRSIIANNLLALNELLNLGSDPNISNNLGETPLYLCVDIDNYDALIILLKYNADTNIAKRNGTTPLHLAAKKNKDNYMHALLRNRANPNLQNKLYSQTATHIAIINKINEEMLYIFHNYNADIYNIKDKYDKTPFDYAKELKDYEYMQLIIKIFGDKNNENNPKLSKTLNVDKIPEGIQETNDKIFNIQKNFHNSNYNLKPEKISIKNNEGKENKNIEIKEEVKIKTNDNENNNVQNESNNNQNKVSILSSGDALYSDRSVSQVSESRNNILNNNINILNEFQPIIPRSDHNEIKPKNSLIKNFKNNINIDTKMIDNSKGIILLINENHESTQFNITKNESNNFFINQKDEKYNKFGVESEKDVKLNYLNNENINITNDIKYNINESIEENKIKNENNTDKEIIKNIISSTIKKININTNTFNSEFSSLNNNSIIQINNNSNSKIEVLKLINFSTNSDINKDIIDNKLANNTNLDNYIISSNNLESGISSFTLYKSKKIENKEESGDYLRENKISEIIPISNKKIEKEINVDNSKLNNEIQFNNCSSTQNHKNKNNKDMEQTVREISNKEALKKKDNMENEAKRDINNNLNKENKENKNYILKNSIENNIYDRSLEYSKSKSCLDNEISLNNKNTCNYNYNPLLNQHHRQLSYHNNKSSINKRRREGENQNEEYINKENDNKNNNEIIYYNKNYLVRNNSAKKEDNNIIVPKTTEIQKQIPGKIHTQSDLNNMNIQKYNSITNKTNSINQKIFTYTSPNINKINFFINDNMNNHEKESNIMNNKNVNKDILKTNTNVNVSNLNVSKEEFFSNNNNNLSSFLNTDKLESIEDKKAHPLIERNNNSAFNVYDDILEKKNLEKKVNLYSETQDKDTSKPNQNNENKNLSNNAHKLRTNFSGSTMGNTTISSLSKNVINPGKQSISCSLNNNNNSSNILLEGKNGNTNTNLNQSEQSNNLLKNIPINMVLRLRDWLISCDLLCYYNLLIENNMYDIDKFIVDLQSNKLKIGYKDIEDLGIRKPGHIFRLLLKLEIDSGILDNNLFNYILSKFNISSSVSNNIILTSSITDINCCGICNKSKNLQSYIKRNDFPYNDIFSFLKYKDLLKYKENFIHNGFDQLEYILLQLFSKHTFDKEVMNDCFHLYNEKDKIDVLNKLYQEKKALSMEFGIENDDNEINNILSNISYSAKYSSKIKCNINDENIFNGNNENNYCNIF